jgi:hypothetical protein
MPSGDDEEADANLEFIGRVTVLCANVEFRRILLQRASFVLSPTDSKRDNPWTICLDHCQFHVAVFMIRFITNNSFGKNFGLNNLLKITAPDGFVYEGEALQLFKRRKYPPLLYLSIIRAWIKHSKSEISHEFWFNNILASVVEVASVSLAHARKSAERFMHYLLNSGQSRVSATNAAKQSFRDPFNFLRDLSPKYAAAQRRIRSIRLLQVSEPSMRTHLPIG